MNTTSNYGFSQEASIHGQAKICAIDAIDRELKRIEDLARCKGGLGKCKLTCHLTDPEAHEELFDQKVDKEEGHSLISQALLAQIGDNKEALALLEQLLQKVEEKGDWHLTDSNAHEELFDQKVDKEEGYSLISQALLAQIGDNKEALALLEQLLQKVEEKGDWHLTDPEAHKELFDQKVDKEEGYSLISQELLNQIGDNKEALVLLEQLLQKVEEKGDWHLTDPEAHEELFDKKVDKQSGYSLISQALLAQIGDNKEALALLEQLLQKVEEKGDWHLTDSNAHKDLFDKKVDKQSGYSLISQALLKQISDNQAELALVGQSIQALQDKNTRLEAELANKANKGSNTETPVTFYDGYATYETDNDSNFCKNAFGEVTFKISATKKAANGQNQFFYPSENADLGRVPSAYKPSIYSNFSGLLRRLGDSRGSQSICRVCISSGGVISYWCPSDANTDGYNVLEVTGSYMAAE